MVRKLVLAVAAASALMSSNMAHALGVGDINLRSALNQPLNAEIELLQVRDLSSAEIRPSLASPDDFGRAGIDRDFFLTDLKFTPEVRSDGRAIIRVTSNKPVREPFLNFLMEVKWPSGRVLREFTLLLDPPLYQPGPAPSQPVPAAASAAQPAMARQQPQVTPPRTSAAQSASGPGSASASSDASGGQVQANSADTLWEIAQRHRPQGASVHQTMLAIQDLNPNAFMDGNINRMLSGSTLTLPNSEQAHARSQTEAINQVAEQNAAWQRGRQVAQPAQRQLDARERDTAAPAPASADGGDSLRLLAGTGEGDGSGSEADGNNGESAQLRDSLDRTKEQLDSTEREKAELADRLQDVQGQLETLQRLLSLKDAQLAALQGQLGAEEQAAGEQGDPAIAQVPPLATTEEVAEASPSESGDAPASEADQAAETSPAEPELAAEPLLNDQQGMVESADAGDQVETAEAAEAAETTEVEPAAEATPVLQPAPAEESATAQQTSAEQDDGVEAMLQRLLQNQTLMLVAGAAALLILLLILMALARRNARREEAMSGDFVATAPRHEVEPVRDDFNVALASFDASEDDQSIAQDPLTEADALVAYGKLEEAAEVLRNGIADDPDRADLRLKLMEVEGLLNNEQGYAAQAETLRAMGGHDADVEALNMRFPMMAAALLGASSVSSADDDRAYMNLDDEAPDTAAAPVAEEDPQDFDFSDFDLGNDEVTEPVLVEPEPVVQTQPAEEEPEFDLDFDLEDTLAEEAQPQSLEYPTVDQADSVETAPTTASSEEVGFDASEFDLNFNLDETAATEEPKAQAPLDSSLEASLDDDYDLSLTEDMQAEQLLAEFEAMQDDSGEVESAAPRTEASVEDFNLSDEDLAGFEDELNASIEAESAEAQRVDVATEEEPVAEGRDDEPAEEESAGLTDALDPFAADLPAEQAMSESMEDEFDFLSGTDECATKLDLARAYIDMGDEEGARDILSEVVDEGSDQQQQDARDMLAQLG
ncbi:pilus assembly protein FimV [Halopseudomonas xinjiangensis]|uniref:Pilus assembly protein FimV n=1 Tax=Halopseudomonas xinjiangensis TaxID=487184 RepID=A0A1H1PT83_9GAMM|nr:FimV/HubP family polar landmark protein [Halopseudomonas xinjiangensis]SDS14355.1 pilus assembly protein FimV [Halopseudomonas xinjiangensis]